MEFKVKIVSIPSSKIGIPRDGSPSSLFFKFGIIALHLILF